MSITPYLYYEDLASAMKFLAKAFGFRAFGARSRNAKGKVIHAGMKLGGNVVLIGSPAPGYRNPKRLGQATQCLLINVRNVDAHFARAVKAGAVVLQPPATTSFGARRYGVTDPEGHEWYFSQPARRKRLGRRNAA